MRVVDRAFGRPMDVDEHAVGPLAGGILQHGYQCGMLWGSVLAAGAEACRRFGPGPKTETAGILAAQKLTELFHKLEKVAKALKRVKDKRKRRKLSVLKRQRRVLEKEIGLKYEPLKEKIKNVSFREAKFNKAKRALVAANLRLVVSIAKKYQHSRRLARLSFCPSVPAP